MAHKSSRYFKLVRRYVLKSGKKGLSQFTQKLYFRIQKYFGFIYTIGVLSFHMCTFTCLEKKSITEMC